LRCSHSWFGLNPGLVGALIVVVTAGLAVLLDRRSMRTHRLIAFSAN